MSDRITESPTARPATISTVFTDARPAVPAPHRGRRRLEPEHPMVRNGRTPPPEQRPPGARSRPSRPLTSGRAPRSDPRRHLHGDRAAWAADDADHPPGEDTVAGDRAPARCARRAREFVMQHGLEPAGCTGEDEVGDHPLAQRAAAPAAPFAGGPIQDLVPPMHDWRSRVTCPAGRAARPSRSRAAAARLDVEARLGCSDRAPAQLRSSQVPDPRSGHRRVAPYH
jgi:hypothetical protein